MNYFDTIRHRFHPKSLIRKIYSMCNQCDQKKWPNVYKSGPKIISQENDRF